MWPAGPKGSPARRRVTGHTVALSGARTGREARGLTVVPPARGPPGSPPSRQGSRVSPSGGNLGGRLSSPRAHRRWCT